ncbi:TPA: terminase small subunit [Haemophilus influenzae]|uniref:terminase small subunit n=1 Tax=Haemophilus influenzae TaxID=727 RepID=UPI0001A3F777|nr:terminase small subunit [Haemophilus influenzae]EEP48439.1 hypothetical protein CGSHi6P18H1_09305 [Haemophilus influenzae 6P18H1]PRJ74269.1 Terminase small subunit [Haemophilus influenzae]PRK94266.1 Terminase small subunit [Haemophilus influenzae]PRK95585.1 Terminase small subunit [Haemophilus influenzae]PRL46784.1 Terminase small subunit [Haemophilus influenzae]
MSDVKGKSTSGRGLTPKQEKFCQLYIELGNASEAYRQSYDCQDMKPESINRLAKKELDKIKIRSRVDVLQQEHRQRHNLTLDNIIADLQEYRDICMGRKPLTITTVVKNAQEGTAQSVNTECFVFEPTGANKALELLGKHLGMFKDRFDVTSGGNALPAVINISFSDEPEEP